MIIHDYTNNVWIDTESGAPATEAQIIDRDNINMAEIGDADFVYGGGLTSAGNINPAYTGNIPIGFKPTNMPTGATTLLLDPGGQQVVSVNRDFATPTPGTWRVDGTIPNQDNSMFLILMLLMMDNNR